jgi:hypothetical protein
VTAPDTAPTDHANYPHRPGRLYDCAACELGPCTCDPATDAPCVSVHCIQTDDEDGDNQAGLP